jgi:hypothetical protein
MASEIHTKDMGAVDHLSRTNTAQSVNISMEMFEKLYLSPANKVSGDLRRTFANPTPLSAIAPSTPQSGTHASDTEIGPCLAFSSPRRLWQLL